MAHAITAREQAIVDHLALRFPLKQVRAATHSINNGLGSRVEALCIAVEGCSTPIHLERERIAKTWDSPETLAATVERSFQVQ